MYLDDEPPIAGGREIWGFPKKLASPSLRVEKDTLLGVLKYGPVPVAVASMGYKHRALDNDKIAASLSSPNFLLKIIPHVDGTARICELVQYFCEDITVRVPGRDQPRLNCFITHWRRLQRSRCERSFPVSTSCRT